MYGVLCVLCLCVCVQRLDNQLNSLSIFFVERSTIYREEIDEEKNKINCKQSAIAMYGRGVLYANLSFGIASEKTRN